MEPENLKDQHARCSETVRRTMLVMLPSSFFVLLTTLSVPDRFFILESEPSFQLQGAILSLRGFLIAASFLLIAELVYLHIFYGYWHELEAMGARHEGREPALFNLDRRDARLATELIFYWWVPLIFFALAVKVAVRPTWAIWLYSLATVTLVGLVFVRIRRCPESRRRGLWRRWTLLVTLIAAWPTVAWELLTLGLHRPFDLASADLSGQRLTMLFLAGASFQGAILDASDFKYSDLREANLVEAQLKNADLSFANLSGANLSRANLSRADLAMAYLNGADLIEADLSGADLSGAHLELADLSGAILIEANLREANLSEATLIEADMSGADLNGANLSRADLSEANLEAADMSEANLSGANLSGANLSGAHLWLKNLSEANLSGAHLPEANLSAANLGAADLSEANLSKATLSEANLSKANLRAATLVEANLREADLSEADLIEANLSEADLSTAVGITQGQLNSAIGSDDTKLPEGLVRPEHWSQ